MSALTQSLIWQRLELMAAQCRQAHLRDGPIDPMIIEAAGLSLDCSRQLWNMDVRQALYDLAQQQGVDKMRAGMFAGEAINHTEGRAVLHTALRNIQGSGLTINGKNIDHDIADVKQRLYHFANQVRQGIWRGATDQRITDIVHIGIGGSDLGPKMVTYALADDHDCELKIHFVSNVDAQDIRSVLRQCRPETTLFIIASKTFTTIETLTNAYTARDWVIHALGPDSVQKHFVAVSTATEKVAEFGIDPVNMFEFWDWVGGRYSVWSAIGLPVILAIGPEKFELFLKGAFDMDCHFQDAPMAENLPVNLALAGIWNRNFMAYNTLAVLPYAHDLQYFPAYLQQLDMESNGKSVDRHGVEVDYDTGPIIFGSAGTNGQHAFYQLLHQGTIITPCEFILVNHMAYEYRHAYQQHQEILLANGLAQPDAMAKGRDIKDADGNPFRVFQGNRPSVIIRMEQLTPYHLGALIALYEHKIFVQSIIWNINAFDQFGVELGKEMALALIK